MPSVFTLDGNSAKCKRVLNPRTGCSMKHCCHPSFKGSGPGQTRSGCKFVQGTSTCKKGKR